MKTVYAVAEGEYSDYRVRVLFEERADAEAHAATLNRGKEPDEYGAARVEEFDFFPIGEKPQRVEVFKIAARRDEERGYSEEERSEVHWDYEIDETEGSAEGRAVASGSSVYDSNGTLTEGMPGYSVNHWSKYFNVGSSGTDRDRVRKAFQDEMYRVKAEYEGLT